jgi:tRNA(Ile)-lysidine synthase
MKTKRLEDKLVKKTLKPMKKKDNIKDLNNGDSNDNEYSKDLSIENNEEIIFKLENRFLESMEELCPLFKEKRFVIAFSGGADSFALLELCLRYIPKNNLLTATMDHAIRDNSSEETLKALSLIKDRGLNSLSVRIKVPEIAMERKKGVEEAGRKARYAFLEDARKEFNGDYIMTGHQLDDLSESILLKLIKGGGPGGLIGVNSKSGRILRPLLSFRADELRNYLTLKGVKWLEDPSNLDTKYRRNLVRGKVIPLLLSINPKVKEALGRLSAISSIEEDFWEENLDELQNTLVLRRDTTYNSTYLIDEEGFSKLHLALKRRLLGRLLRKIMISLPGGGEPLSLRSVDLAISFISSGKRGGIDLPGGRRVERRGLLIHLGKASRFLSKETGELPLP